MDAGGSGSTGSDKAVTPQTESQASLADADKTNEIDEIEVEDDKTSMQNGGGWRCGSSVEGQALPGTGGEVGCSVLLASMLNGVCQYGFPLVYCYSFNVLYYCSASHMVLHCLPFLIGYLNVFWTVILLQTIFVERTNELPPFACMSLPLRQMECSTTSCTKNTLLLGNSS